MCCVCPGLVSSYSIEVLTHALCLLCAPSIPRSVPATGCTGHRTDVLLRPGLTEIASADTVSKICLNITRWTSITPPEQPNSNSLSGRALLATSTLRCAHFSESINISLSCSQTRGSRPVPVGSITKPAANMAMAVMAPRGRPSAARNDGRGVHRTCSTPPHQGNLFFSPLMYYA